MEYKVCAFIPHTLEGGSRCRPPFHPRLAGLQGIEPFKPVAAFRRCATTKRPSEPLEPGREKAALPGPIAERFRRSSTVMTFAS